MQNSKSVGLPSLGPRLRQALRAHRGAARAAGCAAGGFLAANAVILGELAPFGVAFAASVPPRDGAAAGLGAVVGYLAGFAHTGQVRYLTAMLTLFLVRWMFSSGSLARGVRIPRQLLTAVALGLPGGALAMATGGNLYQLVLVGAEALLASCASYFFTRGLRALELGPENLRSTEVTSLVISLCIAVLALSGLTVAGLSLGRVLAAALVLLAARAAREAGGAIAGVSAGMFAGLLAGQPQLMGSYAFGGLLAGVFAPLGRAAPAGVFALVNLCFLLAQGRSVPLGPLAEVFVAGAVSVAVPDGWLLRLVRPAPPVGEVAGETYKALLTGRITHVSQALREVAATTRQVNQRLQRLVDGDPSSVYHLAADRVCRSCRQNPVCWQLRYTDTSNLLNDMLGVLRQGGALGEEQFPEYFRHSCQRLPALCQQLNQLFGEYLARERMRRKVNQVRGVVTDQFEGMALMIDAMGGELDQLAAQDNRTAGKVREYLNAQSVYPDLVTCTVDSGANMTLETVLPSYKLGRLDLGELTADLSEICGRQFGPPARQDRQEQGTTELTFTEKAAYTVRWGASQLGSGGSRLCGDSYSYVDGQGGRVNIILSDGMGSGGAAAVDSTMTAELLKKLAQAGVSLDAALKLVNSALLVRSGEESLATIDITGIDLYTGRVEFYKAGAAPTFLRKSGKGGYVESSSLPVGILEGVNFEKNTVTLREGDWVVMVSDGAVAGGYGWLVSDLERYAGEDPKQLSEQLAAEAYRRRLDGHQDDITVIAIRLERGL